MPEYLAPGVFVEETSYRSKTIEGVGTTTTGFVGPARYGPIDLAPEVVTSVSEFMRVYGDGGQLDFGDQLQHNYLCHGVRAFFEEGGKRLYVARAFRPRVDPDNLGYVKPRPALADDQAAMSGGIYGADGHARLWLSAIGRSMAVATRGFGALQAGVQALNRTLALAGTEAEVEAGRDTGSHADDATRQRALRVSQAVGVGTAGAETGLSLALARAKRQAEAHAAAFAASTIDFAATATAMGKVREAAANAAEPEGGLPLNKVIVPAAVAVADAAALARSAVTALGQAAAAVKTDAAASAALVALAEALEQSCAPAAGNVPGGAAWQVFNDSLTKANALKTQAEPAGGAAVDRAAVAQKAAEAAKQARLASAQALLLAQGAARLRARATADGVDNPTLVDGLALVAQRSQDMEAAADRARTAAQRSDYPRAFAIQALVQAWTELGVELNAVDGQVAHTAQAVAAEPTPPQALSAAVLLRARFPGAAGNVTLRISARLGQNVLVHDPENAAKAKLRGVLENDLVHISRVQPPETPQADLDKLYLARRDTASGDWYFSADGTVANAKFWLNTAGPKRLDAALHAVAVVTAGVELSSADRSRTEAWAGLAFHPGHTRNGAADALSDKFSWAPSNGADARALPVAVLLAADLKTGPQVLAALLQRDAAEAIAADQWPLAESYTLAGGNDGRRPGAEDYKGRGDGPDAPKTGLKAFDDIEDIAIVAAPGSTYLYESSEEQRSQASQIIAGLIAHAELLRYRVAVLDSGDAQTVGQVRAMRARLDTKYAALYYPWIKVRDPVTDAEIDLPPSGFVAGIYARNDIERAVYKAPANEVVRGAIGFETSLNKAQQEVLNPEGVNCFRFFDGRGYRLWGARTASSDPEWKYISVRRYFAYLEHSIDRGTQWAVFEPNGERLWANVRQTIADFLYNEWSNGALLGPADKAFFVKCDRTTMTQNDIDNGRLVCQIGVAVIKPAEFVIFRIGQWTADRKS